MSSLLYYSIASSLTEDEIIEIDKEVIKTREAINKWLIKVASNSKRKCKKLCLRTMFIFQLGQPLAPYVYTVMLPLPPSVERLSPIEEGVIVENSYAQIAYIPKSHLYKMSKMRLTDDKMNKLNNLAMQVNNGSIKLEEAILELRGGDIWIDLLSILAFYWFAMHLDWSFGVEGFEATPLPHQDPFGWLSGKYDNRNAGVYGSSRMRHLDMKKPSSMPQVEYSGMTKSERRKLPDPLGRDRSINVDGYPQLDVRFNQVEFKTPKHGKDHGLAVGNNGKTAKTEVNVLALRDSLVDMANKKDIVWYTNGQYQGGTERGCDCVHVFDSSTNVIAVYEKQPNGSNLFLTTFKLNENEASHLQWSNGNLVTGKILKQRNWSSDVTGITPIDSFSDVTGITPIDSFSDVTGITPIDNSISDN